jgi:hypothetical protein
MRSLSLRCQWVTEADRRPDLVSEALAAQWHSRRIAPRGIGRPARRRSLGAARAVRVTMECWVWGAPCSCPFSCRGCGRARRAHSTPAGRLRSNSWPAVTAPPEAPPPGPRTPPPCHRRGRGVFGPSQRAPASAQAPPAPQPSHLQLRPLAGAAISTVATPASTSVAPSDPN